MVLDSTLEFWQVPVSSQETENIKLLKSSAFFIFYFICLFVCLFVWDWVSLCSPGCPGTHSVDQADLELRNLPTSASQVLGLQAWATTAQLFSHSLKVKSSWQGKQNSALHIKQWQSQETSKSSLRGVSTDGVTKTCFYLRSHSSCELLCPYIVC